MYTQRIKRDKISLFFVTAILLFLLSLIVPPLLLCSPSPSLSLSLPSSFTFALCEGHAIDFPLSIHFSILVLKRGKQTKAIPYPHPRTQPPLPRLTAHRSHPSKSRASHSCSAVQDMHHDRNSPVYSSKRQHQDTFSKRLWHFSATICILSTANHSQFSLTSHQMC